MGTLVLNLTEHSGVEPTYVFISYQGSLESPLMEVIPNEPDLKCWFLLKTVELPDLLVHALGVFLRRHF